MSFGHFYNPPLIVTGAHRSGTSLLASILKDGEVFLGADLDQHLESLSFQDIIEWVLKTAHASWDYPLPLENLFGEKALLQATTEKVQRALQHDSVVKSFNLPKRWLKASSPASSIWGWKDPRNTLLIPLWTAIFPNAKWIVVHRNGHDVARSLVHRELSGHHTTLSSFPLAAGDEDYISYRCRSLGRAFQLWQEQQHLFHHYKPLLPEKQLHILKYEDLCSDTFTVVQDLFEFAELKVDTSVIKGIRERIQTHLDRKQPGSEAELDSKAFRDVPLLHDQNWMKTLGYAE